MSFSLFDDPQLEWTMLSAKLLAEISSIVLKKRLDLELTQEEMAKKMDISQSMLSRFENGLSNPTIRQLAQLIYKLDINIDIVEEKIGLDKIPKTEFATKCKNIKPIQNEGLAAS